MVRCSDKSAPEPVQGRRIGGGFEIESIVASQRAEAARIKERQEKEVRLHREISAQNTVLNRENGHHPDLDDGLPRAAEALLPTESERSKSRCSPSPQLAEPKPRIHKHLATVHEAPQQLRLQQQRKQVCQSMGFPALWSYSQTQIACEELSRGISDMAFSHGGDKIFASSGVLAAYKEMNLSCLQDPLLAPMIARLQQRHLRQEQQTTSQRESDPSAADTSGAAAHGQPENHNDDDTNDDDRLGVERLALPPHALTSLDALHSPPVAVPALESLETVLAFSQLSTQAERRGMKSHALRRLHQRRSAQLLSLLLPDSLERTVKTVLHPKTSSSSPHRPEGSQQPHEGSVPGSGGEVAIRDVIQILFWFVFAAFFHHERIGDVVRDFFVLSKALLAIELHTVTLRHHRLAANGEVDQATVDASSGVIEHTDHRPTGPDFLPYVIIHSVCFLFPTVFPASHDLFTVDFFNRASMLMNIVLTGTESDSQFWVANRQQFFGAAEVSIEEVATAAEVARSESDRLLQRYRDDAAAMQRMKMQRDVKEQARLTSFLKQFDDRSLRRAALSDANRETARVRQGSTTRSPTGRGQSPSDTSLYAPPLEAMELGDPVFHLLNPDVYDAEQAQDIIRQREMRYQSTSLAATRKRHGNATPGTNEAFEPQNPHEEAVYVDAMKKTIFQGHGAAARTAAYLDLKQRFHPSLYPAEQRKAQAIMARHVDALKQQLEDDRAEVVLPPPILTAAERFLASAVTATSPDAKSSAQLANPLDEAASPLEDKVGLSGFVVKFTAMGVRCHEEAEHAARSYLDICKSCFRSESTKYSRSRSNLASRSATEGRPTSYFEAEQSLLCGPPTVSDAPSLSSGPLRREVFQHAVDVQCGEDVCRVADRGASPRSLLDPPDISTVQSIGILAADPTIELRSSPSKRLGEVMFGRRVVSSIVPGAAAAVPFSSGTSMTSASIMEDEELCEAVHDISKTMFRFSDDDRPPKTLSVAEVNSTSTFQSIPGSYAPSAVNAVRRFRSRGPDVLGSEPVDQMPLALKSFFSFKAHESAHHDRISPSRQNQSPTVGHRQTDNAQEVQSFLMLTEGSGLSKSVGVCATSPALNAYTPAARQHHPQFGGTPGPSSPSLARRDDDPVKSTTKLHSVFSMRRPPSSTPVPTSVPSKVVDRPRTTTPVSQPHGTLLLKLNATIGTPSAAAHAQPSRSEKTSNHWLSMTQTVQRTQKYIDDAVRIHNAQSTLRSLVDERFSKDRDMSALRQRAVDKTFDEEMHVLRSRISDPLQRSLLVNDWITREPPRRKPDRDKNADLLRGTLLAEEAQHTSILVREGLKKLEHTFARRRKQTRKQASVR